MGLKVLALVVAAAHRVGDRDTLEETVGVRDCGKIPGTQKKKRSIAKSGMGRELKKNTARVGLGSGHFF